MKDKRERRKRREERNSAEGKDQREDCKKLERGDGGGREDAKSIFLPVLPWQSTSSTPGHHGN